MKFMIKKGNLRIKVDFNYYINEMLINIFTNYI